MQRTAERAVFVDSLAQVPERLAEIARTSYPDRAGPLKTFARAGRIFSGLMLGYVHGDRSATLPPSADVGDWGAIGLRLMGDLTVVDPEWVRLWGGLVRNRVTGEGATNVSRAIQRPPARPAVIGFH